MQKKEFTKEELAAIEARSKKAMADFAARQKENPQLITNKDVARIMGMDEDMIEDLFGEERNKNAEGNTEGEHGNPFVKDDEIL